MDDKDNGMKMGSGAMGWNGTESGSAQENGPVTRGEAQEGAFGVKMDIDGFGIEKARGEALNGLKMEKGNLNGWDKNVQPKKKQTIILAAILVVVVLVGVGIGIWYALSANNERKDDNTGQIAEPEKPDNVKEPEEEGSTEEEIEAKKVEVLSTDNQAVQRLWHNFDGVLINSKALYQFVNFYRYMARDGGLPSPVDQVAMIIELQTPGHCKMEFNERNAYARYVEEAQMFASTDDITNATETLYNNGCYAGEIVREKAKEIFGNELNLSDVTGMIGIAYSPEYDEYYDVNMGRGSSMVEFERLLERAERDGDKVYLYGDVRVVAPAEVYYSVDDIYPQEYAGRFSLDQDSYPYGRGNNYFDHFRWIFTKNGDGEYIFTGLERL